MSEMSGNSDNESVIELQEEASSSRSSSPERNVRGRGRGRGRGQGARGSRRGSGSRGRESIGQGRRASGSRSRGRSRSRSQPGRADEAVRNIQQRQDSMRDEINRMTEEECKNILLSVLEKSPAVMIDIMRPAVRQPGGYHPGPDFPVPDWCVCTKCREMPTNIERVCCGKENCISLIPDFQVLILDEAVLALARLLRRDILVYDDEPDLMAANRHTAYRQYILWTFGHLGVGDRRVIPSCCVWRIRDKFPDAFGQYTGFKPSRLG